MTAENQSSNRVSKFEVSVLGVILLGGFSLLLPALPASREAARANLCRRNLRWLDQATQHYIDNQRRLPDAVTWPVELLPRLHDQVGRDKHRPNLDIFNIDRPMYLTCPSRSDVGIDEGGSQTSHYTLIIDRDKRVRWDRVAWKFRDRPLLIPEDARKPWYIGNELTMAAAEEQLLSSHGPHAGGTFLESDSHGSSLVRDRNQ